jgi:hypothetical protein
MSRIIFTNRYHFSQIENGKMEDRLDLSVGLSEICCILPFVTALTTAIRTPRVKLQFALVLIATISIHQLGSLWQPDLAIEGRDTDALTAPYRQNGGKGTHFNDADLKAHGLLWADKVSQYIDAMLH